MSNSWTTYDNDDLPIEWKDEVFRYCQFNALDLEGEIFTGALLGCEFKASSFYLGLFNNATLARTRFEDCAFNGTSFKDCVLTECEFIRCHFAEDNMGGECQFDGSRWYACKQSECIGLDVDAVIVCALTGENRPAADDRHSCRSAEL